MFPNAVVDEAYTSITEWAILDAATIAFRAKVVVGILAVADKDQNQIDCLWVFGRLSIQRY